MHECVRDGLPYRFLRIVGHVFAKCPFEKRAGSHVFRNGCDRFRDHDGNGSDEIVRVEEPLARLRQRCLGRSRIRGERHAEARKVFLRIEPKG